MYIPPSGDPSNGGRSSKGSIPRLVFALALTAIVIFLATHWHWIGHQIARY